MLCLWQEDKRMDEWSHMSLQGHCTLRFEAQQSDAGRTPTACNTAQVHVRTDLPVLNATCCQASTRLHKWPAHLGVSCLYISQYIVHTRMLYIRACNAQHARMYNVHMQRRPAYHSIHHCHLACHSVMYNASNACRNNYDGNLDGLHTSDSTLQYIHVSLTYKY